MSRAAIREELCIFRFDVMNLLIVTLCAHVRNERDINCLESRTVMFKCALFGVLKRAIQLLRAARKRAALKILFSPEQDIQKRGVCEYRIYSTICQDIAVYSCEGKCILEENTRKLFAPGEEPGRKRAKRRALARSREVGDFTVALGG